MSSSGKIWYDSSTSFEAGLTNKRLLFGGNIKTKERNSFLIKGVLVGALVYYILYFLQYLLTYFVL